MKRKILTSSGYGHVVILPMTCLGCLGCRREFYFNKTKEVLLFSDVSHIKISVVLVLEVLRKIQAEKRKKK